MNIANILKIIIEENIITLQFFHPAVFLSRSGLNYRLHETLKEAKIKATWNWVFSFKNTIIFLAKYIKVSAFWGFVPKAHFNTQKLLPN